MFKDVVNNESVLKPIPPAGRKVDNNIETEVKNIILHHQANYSAAIVVLRAALELFKNFIKKNYCKKI